MEVGERSAWVNAVVTVVLVNREGNEEHCTMSSWMGKIHQARSTPSHDLHGFPDFSMMLLIALRS